MFDQSHISWRTLPFSIFIGLQTHEIEACVMILVLHIRATESPANRQGIID